MRAVRCLLGYSLNWSWCYLDGVWSRRAEQGHIEEEIVRLDTPHSGTTSSFDLRPESRIFTDEFLTKTLPSGDCSLRTK